MAESGNIFENFISNFYVKFGRLQIRGFHGKVGNIAANFNASGSGMRNENSRTVSPGKQRMMSNVKGAQQPGQQQSRSRVVQGHTYGQ